MAFADLEFGAKSSTLSAEHIQRAHAWRKALDRYLEMQAEVASMLDPRTGAVADGEQRSERWFKLREARLTASAFSNALGFWNTGRRDLWEEKLAIKAPFAGNDATRWGTKLEPVALRDFEIITGNVPSHEMFRVLGTDPIHNWFGGSPDGLLEGTRAGRGGEDEHEDDEDEMDSRGRDEDMNMTTTTATTTTTQGNLSTDLMLGTVSTRQVGDSRSYVGAEEEAEIDAGDFLSRAGWSESQRATVRDHLTRMSHLTGDKDGILEIKCPYFGGKGPTASPWTQPPYYYMPQIQGLLYLYDRPWAQLYCWTPSQGSVVFHIERDRAYWAEAWPVISEFWWLHVVPARSHLRQVEDGALLDVDLRDYVPAAEHPRTKRLIQWSKSMAGKAEVFAFPPVPATTAEREEAVREWRVGG